MNVERAVLTCSSCGVEADHELRYTGRLLHSTRCTECGHVLRHDQREFYTAYLRDLEHRVASKPMRLMRAASRSASSSACRGQSCASPARSPRRSGRSGAAEPPRRGSATGVRPHLDQALEQRDLGPVRDPASQARGGHPAHRRPGRADQFQYVDHVCAVGQTTVAVQPA